MKISLTTVQSGYDRKTCWVAPIMATLPDNPDKMLILAHKLLLSGTDRFFGMNMTVSRDRGASWDKFKPIPGFGENKGKNGSYVALLTSLKQHRQTGTLLAVGGDCGYKVDGGIDENHSRSIVYSRFDQKSECWAIPRKLIMPNTLGTKSVFCCMSQFVVKADGEILLPVQGSFAGRNEPLCSVILRCSFDGENLKCIGHSDLISNNIDRGLYEPSLIHFQDKYILTLRNDQSGYVCWNNSPSGFNHPQKWQFDNGEWLGNYNTQQHWLTLGENLYLIYTRKGLNNDHVFRHRAPLLISRVDPETLTVIRDTEKIVVPERGARLGNFAVTRMSSKEAYVTVAEWMQTNGPNHSDCRFCERYGSDNSIFMAKIEV